MKSTRVRVLLAVAAAGAALTACSPGQAGAAAIVGGDRISSSELDSSVREYEGELAKLNVSPSQLQLPGSTSQIVLFQLVTAKQYTKAAESQGVTATDAEIDQEIAKLGGEGQYEQRLLQQAVAPSHAREYVKARVLINNLLAKYGGGTDDASRQKGEPQVIKDLQAVPVTWNPRYGKLNTEQTQGSLFVDAGRFGAVPAAAQAPVQPQ
ncbi:SurA N-terminal domain-containing protein [Streptosporangium sp. NPDC051022]|uniref:SurA N-terminal domain-containing protein n=1 Tax=Streptosporangium sp. NPDC051022 TaxID=3155752 RepID=UPI00343F3C6B